MERETWLYHLSSRETTEGARDKEEHMDGLNEEGFMAYVRCVHSAQHVWEHNDLTI